MIVDRSSFDEEDREDDLSVMEGYPEEGKLRRRSDGKVRRKMRWKPQAFRSKNRKSMADSVITERSAKTSKSVASFHTFASTETPVQSNQKNQKPPPLTRPNYRDTFEGVATIESEGQYIHAKTKQTKNLIQVAQQKELQRSRTLPEIRGFDFQSIDGEAYSTDDLDTVPHVFDPFGDSSNQQQQQSAGGFSKKRRPPSGASSRRITKDSRQEQQPSPGESPLSRKLPVDVLHMSSPGDVPLSMIPSDISEEHVDDSFVLREDFTEDLQVSFFNTDESDDHTGLGISPIRIPTVISPFATPIKHPPSGRPPMAASSGKPPMAPRYQSSPSPIKPPTPMSTPVQATIGSSIIDLSDSSSPASSLNSMLASSGILQGSPMPDMPITTAANRPYNRPNEDAFSTPIKKRSFRLRLGSDQDKKLVTDDDTISASSPSPSKGNQVIVVTNQDSVKPGNVVRHGSRLVSSTSASVGSSARSVSSATRNQTGPVDVDEGAFVEAELHLKAIHEMAAEHLAHGEYEEALDVFEEILRGQKERYGADHYRIGTALHNIGIVHLKSGNFPKAVLTCTQAVRVRKQTLVPNHPDVAVSLAQLGVAQLECKRHRKALVAFREALQIRRDFLGPKHPKVGKILNNVGCALYELNEMEGARLAFEEALQIQRETLRNSSPVAGDEMETRSNSNSALLSIAATLCNLGSIQVRYSNFDEASVALEEALLIQQSVLGDEHPTVLNTIDSIDHIDKSMDGSKDRTAATDFFSQWTGTSETASLSDGSNEMNDSPSAGKLLALMSTMTWSRSKKFYQKIGAMIPHDSVACGGMTDVVDDNFSSAGASEGSSTWSFREAKQSGYEI